MREASAAATAGTNRTAIGFVAYAAANSSARRARPSAVSGSGAPSRVRAKAAALPAAVVLLALTMAAFCAAPAVAGTKIHAFDYSFDGHETPQGGQYGFGIFPTGVAVDNSSGASAGDVYVGANAYHLVDKYSPSTNTATYVCQVTGLGELSSSPSECDKSAGGPGSFPGVFGLAVDPSNGSLNVVATGIDELQRYTDPSSGQYTLTFEGQTTKAIAAGASGGEVETALEELSTIGSGNVNVSKEPINLGRNDFFVYFVGALADKDVEQMTASGGSPTPVVTTETPGGPNGVDRFSATGVFEKQLNLGTNQVRRVAASAGKVFVANEGTEHLEVWEPASNSLTTFSTGADTPAGDFGELIAVAVDEDPTSASYKDVYATDNAEHVVDKFDETGKYICQITGAGSSSTSASECSTSEPGIPSEPLNGLFGLAVDPTNGHVYVGEFPAVQEFSASGNYVSTINREESPTGMFGFNLSVSKATDQLFVSSDTNGRIVVFGGDLPKVTTGQATGVTATTATLHGTVNPFGTSITSCKFEYVSVEGYEPAESSPYAGGGSAPCVESVTGEAPVSVHADVSGLEAGKIYHFRLVATNGSGTTVGEDEFFGPPSVEGEGASELTRTSAHLNGTINPNNVATSYQFEYGTAAGVYPNKVPVAPQAIGSGKALEEVSQDITGLQVGTEYHYRLTATNSLGTTHGPDKVFKTVEAVTIDPQPPAPDLSTSTATLQAYVNPLGTATSYRFEWGASPSYGNVTPTTTAGSGSNPVMASAPLSGLQPGTTYHYRVVADNGLGQVEGPDQTLETEAVGCSNESRREEQGQVALELPDCRAFEQVSPEQKNMQPAVGGEITASGERVQYRSEGSFAGNNYYGLYKYYVADRTGTGWVTKAIQPYESQTGGPYSYDYGQSADLGRSAWEVDQGTIWGHFHSGIIYLREPDGSLVQASPVLESLDPNRPFGQAEGGSASAQGGTPDLSHIILEAQVPLNNEDTLPLSPGTAIYRLYDLTTRPTPSLKFIQLNTAGEPVNGGEGQIALGGVNTSGYNDQTARYHDISEDGSKIFFTAANEIYARINDASTVELTDLKPSENLECTTAACKSAGKPEGNFAGASADGSKAFFMSGRQLTDEATNNNPGHRGCPACPSENGGNIYMYGFGRPAGHKLMDITRGDTSGLGPQVQGILRISKEGSHVYFIARGVLTSEPNGLGQSATAGVENLYEYDTETEEVRYIAELCSGEEKSGTHIGVAQCPNEESDEKLLNNSGRDFVTPDGETFIFTSYGQLVPDDSNLSADVYRYNATTGSLARVSVGHHGEDLNGNGGGGPGVAPGAVIFPPFEGEPAQDLASGNPSQQAGNENRPMSDDGESVVFMTARPLQSTDENGKRDVYEWHDGQVTLISGAQSTRDVGAGGIGDNVVSMSASGRDVLFETDTELLHGDADGLTDIYDARIDGGFPFPPPEAAPCGGPEACHGPPAQEPTPPTLGSESFHSSGNVHEAFCHKGFVRRHGKCVKKHKKYHRRKKHHRRSGNGTRGQGK